MTRKQLPAKGKSKGTRSRYDRIVLAGIIISLSAIALILWAPLRTDRPGNEKKTGRQEKTDGVAEKEDFGGTKKQEGAPGRPLHKTFPVAIVIDDLGQDMKAAQEILSLPAKITFAVLPGLSHSQKIAILARQNGRDLLLHLPMEYRNKKGSPAPGMLRANMTPMDFLNTVSEDAGSVPNAIGVNNHEGSLLTENKEAMKFLMAELKARNLLFLDSVTSPRSVAFATAKEFGLKAAKRDVFLDNESDNPASIGKQLEELARLAQVHGRGIGIGHPHPATINALRKWLPTAAAQGIEIVPVSRLMQ